MTTRAQLILERINTLKLDLEKLNLKEYSEFIFDSQYDLCDVVFLLSMTFNQVNDLQEIENIIRNGISSRNLPYNLRALEEIRDFVVWFKKLQ